MPSKLNYWEESNRSWSEDSVWISNTPSLSTRQTFFYVEEIGYFWAYPSYYTRRANLNSFLILHTLSGKGRLEIAGQQYALTPGTTSWINCCDQHDYACDHPGQWEFLWFHFNGPCALGYYEEFIKSGSHMFRDTDCGFTRTNMRKLLDTIQHKTTQSDITASGYISELLTHLLIMSSDTRTDPRSMPAYVKDAIKRISQDFRRPVSLDDLAKAVGISKYHFAREFKRYTNMTPNEYLITTRLNFAKELLKYSSLSIEQITYECGFHYLSYFAKQFYKHENLTPLQFRKLWKSES